MLFLELGEARKLGHIAGHSEPGIPLHDCPMCGTSIVIRRRQHEGDRAYCRACGADTKIRLLDGNTVIEATGQRGTPAQLEPEIDTDFVRELVKESALLFNSTFQ